MGVGRVLRRLPPLHSLSSLLMPYVCYEPRVYVRNCVLVPLFLRKWPTKSLFGLKSLFS